ncbi:hypothetical protein AAG906_004461 [Vitis piasezkii]
MDHLKALNSDLPLSGGGECFGHQLDAAVKTQIKTCLLQTLSSPVPDARSTASQVIAKIAGIEQPQKQWPELIRSLLSNIHQLPAHVKQATLETLGYLYEEVSPDVVNQDPVNKILTAVVQGMNSSEGTMMLGLLLPVR